MIPMLVTNSWRFRQVSRLFKGDLVIEIVLRLQESEGYLRRSASSSLVSIDLGLKKRRSSIILGSFPFRRSTPSLAWVRERIMDRKVRLSLSELSLVSNLLSVDFRRSPLLLRQLQGRRRSVPFQILLVGAFIFLINYTSYYDFGVAINV